METARISPATVQTFKRAVPLLDVPASEGKAAVRILEAACRPTRVDMQPSLPAGPRMLTVAEAARRLSCSTRTVARMLDDGTLSRRYLRPGNAKSLRVSAIEVEALACGQEVA